MLLLLQGLRRERGATADWEEAKMAKTGTVLKKGKKLASAKTLVTVVALRNGAL